MNQFQFHEKIHEIELKLISRIFIFQNSKSKSMKSISRKKIISGMELFIEVLDTFPGDKCIETKVLGLLNNIAEVAHLRSHFYGQSLKLM